MSPLRRVFFSVVIISVTVAAVAAGRWQLRRLAGKRANNAVLAAAAALAPQRLPAPTSGDIPVDSGRRVIARGHFETSDQVILRGRVQNDGPGLQIVTPFLLDSTTTTLWVLRGFVASPDAVTPPDPIPAPDSGTLEIRGVALAIPVTADSGAALVHNGVTTWKRLDRSALARRRPGSLPVYLLLEGDSTNTGGLVLVPAPPPGEGPHLSYALQWFGIALAVFTFGVVILWRDGRASPPRLEAP